MTSARGAAGAAISLIAATNQSAKCRLVAWLSVSLVSTTALDALAAPTAEERAVARDLFKEAIGAEEAEEWARCEAALSEAVELVETPGLRFHLAYCKEQQQRWVEALVDYKRADEMMAKGEDAEDVKVLLPEAITRLERELPRLTLVLDPVPAEATLYIDGAARSQRLFGKAIPLDPGTRRVEVIVPQHEAFRHELTLLPRERREVDIVLVSERTPMDATSKAVPVPKAEPEETRSGLSPKSYVMISEGVIAAVGLGVGIAFSIEASDQERRRDAIAKNLGSSTACAGTSPNRYCSALQDATDQRNEAQTFAAAAYVTSAVSACALIGTWLLWDDTKPAAVSIAPTHDGFRAAVRARF